MSDEGETDMPATGSSERTDRRWWANRWWAVMETIGMSRRLERGKRYARSERVLSLEVSPERVTAEVQGSRYDPYLVEIGLDPFSDEEWKRAVEALASQALFSAKLLGGEMPDNIEEAFAAAGLSLFPTSANELRVTCSCPDAIAPCKHIVALHYVLADKLDADPFLLFRWRGRPKERMLRELRQQRASAVGGTPFEQKRRLEDSMEHYWNMGASLDNLAVSVGPPRVYSALLKRLGLPAFWKSHPEIRGSLERLYAKVTERAMALAYGGRGIHGNGSEEEP